MELTSEPGSVQVLTGRVAAVREGALRLEGHPWWLRRATDFAGAECYLPTGSYVRLEVLRGCWLVQATPRDWAVREDESGAWRGLGR